MPRKRRIATETGTRNNTAPATRRRSRHLDGVKKIDREDYDFLRQFVTEHGKIIASRLTGASAKQQRKIKRGIRNARTMGLLP